jgi:hypothetical protein
VIIRGAQDDYVPVYFDGTQLQEIYFNGAKVESLIHNGTKIFMERVRRWLGWRSKQQKRFALAAL